MEPMIQHRSRVSVSPVALGAQKWELPPLILHPFSDQSGPKKLVQSSRASLILNGAVVLQNTNVFTLLGPSLNFFADEYKRRHRLDWPSEQQPAGICFTAVSIGGKGLTFRV